MEIIDHGVGIGEQDLPSIFDRFYQAANSSGQTSDQGSGLGLAIVQRILQLHHAAIQVDSELGRGTRFSFGLPVAKLG